MHHTTFFRTVRAVEREAADRGFHGDIFAPADDVPLIGTLREQMALAAIAVDAAQGRPTSARNRELRRRLARAVVLTSPAPQAALAQQQPQPTRRRAW